MNTDLKEQLSELMHEIMLMNKQIFEEGDYSHLLTLCERDITILASLSGKNDLTAKEISILCKMPKTTVVTAVTRLVQKGYIERIINKADRREMFLVLTEKGEQANREHFDYENLILNALVARWSDDKQEKLARLLQERHPLK